MKFTSKSILLIIFGIFTLHFQINAQLNNALKVEKAVSKVIDQSLASSVRISAYDTLRKQASSSGFSGVAVSKEGHILTVAHATKPNQYYMVSFPNGGQYVAVGMGRIAIKNDSVALDLALIKIIEKGNWAFADLAESANMKINELCVSISYPESFAKKIPNVRLGRLTDVGFKDGIIESTCKMEPGDSGGGLFNGEGKLLGLHSFIKQDEEQNFEVPIYFYKKYWTALNIAIDYKKLPTIDSLYGGSNNKTADFTMPSIQSLAKLDPAVAAFSLTINSKLNGEPSLILGTIFSIAGKKNKGYIVSKSSMVGNDPSVKIGNETISAKILCRQAENDLVLIELPNTPLKGVILADGDSVNTNLVRPGLLLISALGSNHQYVSVLSTSLINMPRSPGGFGANANFINQKVTITQIFPRGSSDGVLKLKDVITAINGVPITLPAHYNEQTSKFSNGDTIAIDLVREDKEVQVKMLIKMFESNHVAYRFNGGRSFRSDGFKRVLIHDAAVKANECGGPVFGIDNRFFGINIARHSRTSAVILPKSVIENFINQSIKK